jgi:hypothetical protein
MVMESRTEWWLLERNPDRNPNLAPVLTIETRRPLKSPRRIRPDTDRILDPVAGSGLSILDVDKYYRPAGKTRRDLLSVINQYWDELSKLWADIRKDKENVKRAYVTVKELGQELGILRSSAHLMLHQIGITPGKVWSGKKGNPSAAISMEEYEMVKQHYHRLTPQEPKREPLNVIYCPYCGTPINMADYKRRQREKPE